jgi:hypothetical protein
VRDRRRYEAYNEWCRKHDKPARMSSESFSAIGKIRYRDGGVYEGRKFLFSFIPIMFWGGEEIALRWERRYDIQAIEALRWKLLNLYKDKFLPRYHEAAKAFKGKGAVWAHDLKGTLHIYKYSKNNYSSVEVEHIELDKLDLLTRLAYESSPTAEGQAMVSRYEKARHRQWACIGTANRLSHILQEMLRELIRSTRKDAYDHTVAEFTINGRHYPTTHASVGGPDLTQSWPSPFRETFNLDDAAACEKLMKELDAYKHPYGPQGRAASTKAILHTKKGKKVMAKWG